MRVKYGSIVTDGSGKLGGHVASKGRSGSVIRTKVTGTNPRTTAQNSTRALLGSLAAGWSSLTEEERQSFDSAVDKFKSTDIFGDVLNPSGYNLYIKLNFNAISAGFAQLTSAPEPQFLEFNPAINAEFYRDYPESSLIYFQIEEYANYRYMIKASPGVSPGISNGKSLLKVIGYLNNDSSYLNYGYIYQDIYPIQTAGDYIFLSVTRIFDNGQKGQEYFLRTMILGD
jgi:hypothetical protein